MTCHTPYKFLCTPLTCWGGWLAGAGRFHAKQLRHPAGIGTTSCGSFVPNDITLGGGSPTFILLTGPNMGGKSTMLRQVCLATVLAQVKFALSGWGLAVWYMPPHQLLLANIPLNAYKQNHSLYSS